MSELDIDALFDVTTGAGTAEKAEKQQAEQTIDMAKQEKRVIIGNAWTNVYHPEGTDQPRISYQIKFNKDNVESLPLSDEDKFIVHVAPLSEQPTGDNINKESTLSYAYVVIGETMREAHEDNWSECAVQTSKKEVVKMPTEDFTNKEGQTHQSLVGYIGATQYDYIKYGNDLVLYSVPGKTEEGKLDYSTRQNHGFGFTINPNNINLFEQDFTIEGIKRAIKEGETSRVSCILRNCELGEEAKKQLSKVTVSTNTHMDRLLDNYNIDHIKKEPRKEIPRPKMTI